MAGKNSAVKNFSKSMRKDLPAIMKSIGERLRSLHLHLSPPNSRDRLSPEEQTTVAANRQSAEILSQPENPGGDVSSCPRFQDVVLPPICIGGCRLIGVMDTPAAVFVPGSIAPKRHDPQNAARGRLQRNNAVRRSNQDPPVGTPSVSDRSGERVVSEDSHDESRGGESRRSRHIKTDSPTSTTIELSPTPPRLRLPIHLDELHRRGLVAQAVRSNPLGTDRYPFVRSNSDHESSAPVPAGALDDQDPSLQFLSSRRADKSDACEAAALRAQLAEDGITIGSARDIARDAERTDICTVHPTCSRRSHLVVVETAPSDTLGDEDEERADRIKRQQKKEDQLKTRAWWTNIKPRSES